MISETVTARQPEAGAAQFPTARPSPDEVYFEYLGRTGLTVLGPLTGRRYRFNAPGATLAIDGRDAPSMVAVPNLRRTKNPA